MADGCRVDNGRCLARVAKPAGADHAFVEFTDGYVYRMKPVYDLDMLTIATLADQPGCWFNFGLSKRPGYKYQRLGSFPQIPSSGWLSIIW